MLLIFKLFLLIALLRALTEYNKPLVCSAIYGAGSLILGAVFMSMTFGASFSSVVVGALVDFVAATIFFWVLDKLEGSALWWLVLIVGIPVVLGLGLVVM